MGELARAVTALGGQVTGVIPQRMKDVGLAYEQANEMIVTESMSERKARMVENADSFVALPGGLGTLEELTQVIALKQLGYLSQAIVLLNTAGFWNHLLSHFKRIRQQRFTGLGSRQLYCVATRPREALDYIERYEDGGLRSSCF